LAGRKTEVGDVEDHPLDAADIVAGWDAVTAARLAPRPLMVPDHPATHRVVKRNRTVKAPPSETELLKEIRELRRNGDWQGTAEKYETLIRTHRSSSAARAALISLGELRLKKLHAPGAALALFNRYLGLNEPTLAREALLGKASALSALGRRDEVEEVLRAFLRRFPDAVQADAVRRQLRDTKNDSL
jgi:tetratricopeptide (TPR) repeat protein